MLAFSHSLQYRAGDRATRIYEAFERDLGEGSIDLLFIHTDGGSQTVADAVRERVQPAADRLAVIGDRFGTIPIIPVRETEAWALCDLAALQEEIGLKFEPGEIGLDQAALENVEALQNPKEILKQVFEIGVSRRRRRNLRAPSIPGSLADRISDVALQKLQSFLIFKATTCATLARLWGVDTYSE